MSAVFALLATIAASTADVDKSQAFSRSVSEAFGEALDRGCADSIEHGRAILPARFASRTSPPSFVRSGATAVRLGTSSYFHAPARDGDVWIIVFDASPMCFIQAYGSGLKQAEQAVVAMSSAGAWRDEKIQTVRGDRQIRVFATDRKGKRVQMVLITPVDFDQLVADGTPPLTISGYVEAVEQGK